MTFKGFIYKYMIIHFEISLFDLHFYLFLLVADYRSVHQNLYNCRHESENLAMHIQKPCPDGQLF